MEINKQQIAAIARELRQTCVEYATSSDCIVPYLETFESIITKHLADEEKPSITPMLSSAAIIAARKAGELPYLGKQMRRKGNGGGLRWQAAQD